ncbi:hypothetical protein ACPXBC_30265, partial [Escherichia coli]|uniref:hypothetical protein n=1 Tax=Escherichia coli TaxID=562 RepID=UPI003CE53477
YYHPVIPAGIDAPAVTICASDIDVGAIVPDTGTSPLIRIDQSGHRMNVYEAAGQRTIKNPSLRGKMQWESPGFNAPTSDGAH